jgi:CrcB protein
MSDQPHGRLPVDPDLPVLPSVGASSRRPRRTASRRWDVALVIGAGGALGAAARWGLNEMWPTAPGQIPWATFVENVSGSLVLGALMVVLLDVRRPTRYARPFLGIGVLGGYTTFSTYAADTGALLRGGHSPIAVAYLFGTLVLALVGCWAGITLARIATGLNGSRRRTS